MAEKKTKHKITKVILATGRDRYYLTIQRDHEYHKEDEYEILAEDLPKEFIQAVDEISLRVGQAWFQKIFLLTSGPMLVFTPNFAFTNTPQALLPMMEQLVVVLEQDG